MMSCPSIDRTATERPADPDRILRPCPFCGGRGKLRKDNVYIRGISERVAWVYCANCNCRTNYVRQEKHPDDYGLLARQAWNRRFGNGKI